VTALGELTEWQWCPRCREALQRGDARVECPACGFVAYASSKATAGALVEDGGRILLARRAFEPFKGAWDIPGGFLEEGEHPEDGLRRELREETGLDVEPGEFIGCWMDVYGEDGAGQSTLNLYWAARRLGGEEHAADDVSELQWFEPGELPAAPEFAFHIAEVVSAWRDQQA
jgi:ADP-ribose pyrophosphatase YjhB (NUDIX family)